LIERGGTKRFGRRAILEPLEPRLLLDAIRTPWVAGVTETSVYVCVEADSAGPNAVVDYGTTDLYGLQAVTESTQATSSGRYVHNVKLTGLLPNTQYHYRLTQGSIVSADAAFWTAPPAGTAVRWGFAADTQTRPTVHDAIIGLIDTYDPRMMVYGGDLVSHYDQYSWWETDWFIPNQSALNATTPWVAAPGNHDGWPAWTKAFTQSPEGDGVNGDGYFSFDYGDAHIVIVNNYVPDGPGSAQWNWVAADLAATTKTWKIVAFHEPAYVTWQYGEGGNADMKAMTTQIFEPNGVDMVLNGHYHFYQHNLVNGIHHMVVSSCGGTIEPGVNGPYSLYTEQTYTFGIFDMTYYSLTLSAYRDNNTLIESFTLTKDVTPPPAPANLAASAVSDTEMWLTWDEAVDPESGVDYYNVYRGGQLIGTTTQTCYADTGLAKLTGYSYEVSAVNLLAAEGAKSDPATRTTLDDTKAPEIAAAWSCQAGEVEVMFSEPVEQASAENAANYAIDNGVTISGATLQADLKTVRLATSALSQPAAYTLTVSGVRDRAGSPNTIAPASQAAFEYVPWAEQDIGTIAPPGSMSYSAGQYTILSNGSSLFGHVDNFHYVYRTLDGDGEIIARVVNDGQFAGTKSGVMMRDTLDANSAEVSVLLMGQAAEARLQVRSSAGELTDFWSAQNAGEPYYARLVRSGGVFSGYVSPTGADGTWVQVGPDASVSDMAGGTVYVGLAACAGCYGYLVTFYQDNVKIIEYGPNTAPTGAADAYAFNQDAHLNVAPARGVLANDTDGEGDDLSAVLVSGPSHGTLALYANGSFGYTPQAGYYGSDSFTYKPNDGRDDGGATAVSIQVAQIGQIPGDANLDNAVNLADFTVLKSNFGTEGTWGNGDFNSDGMINLSDFTILKAHFGESLSAGSAAPPSQAVSAETETASAVSPDSSVPGASPAAVGLAVAPSRGGAGGRARVATPSGRRAAPPVLPPAGPDVASAARASEPHAAGEASPPSIVASAGGNTRSSLEVDLSAGMADILAEAKANLHLRL